jgi:hypothetical protein
MTYLQVTPHIGDQLLPKQEFQSFGNTYYTSSIRSDPLANLILNNRKLESLEHMHCNGGLDLPSCTNKVSP